MASIAAAALLILLLGAPAVPAAAQGLVLPKVSLEAVEAKSPQ